VDHGIFSSTLPEVDDNLLLFVDILGEVFVTAPVHQLHRMQEDVDILETWVEKCQIGFNPDKCETMHFGRSNACRNYTVNGRILRSIDRQRDLGSHVH